MAEQIMHRDLHFGCKFILLAVLTLTLFAEASGLKCYQCHGFLTNEECNRDENLKDCEDEDALVYDVCESLVKYIGNQKQISKVCAKGPCTLETKNQNSALNMAEECVNNECRFCCSTDGCNTSAATPSMRMGTRTLLPSVTIAAMFVLCIQLAL